MATPKKRESKQDKVDPVDDNENKGRSGKVRRQGRRATKQMKREEQQMKDDLKYNPVVDKSKDLTDSGFDYTQTNKQQRDRYKKGPSAEKAVEKSNKMSAFKNFLSGQAGLQRFQGSTKKLGNTTAMNAMMKQAIKPGLSAALSENLKTAGKAAQSHIEMMGKTGKMQSKDSRDLSMPQQEAKKPGSSRGVERLKPVVPAPLPKGLIKPIPKTIGKNPEFVGGAWTPSDRTMELSEAHSQSAVGVPVTPDKPKKKKGGKRKRKIKAKF